MLGSKVFKSYMRMPAYLTACWYAVRLWASFPIMKTYAVKGGEF